MSTDQTGDTCREDETAVRWALGDEVSDEEAAVLVSRSQEPPTDKSIADLLADRRLHELDRRFKDLGISPQ